MVLKATGMVRCASRPLVCQIVIVWEDPGPMISTAGSRKDQTASRQDISLTNLAAIPYVLSLSSRCARRSGSP